MEMIVVMRHGHDHLDVLTEQGKRQVVATATQLRFYFPKAACTRIFHSQENRSKETAAVVAGVLHLPPDRAAETHALRCGAPRFSLEQREQHLFRHDFPGNPHVILIVHYEEVLLATNLAAYLGQEYFENSIPYGHAVILRPNQDPVRI